MKTHPGQRQPDTLPDPWLFDTEALLRGLDRCRETVLQIPITNPNATHFGIHLAVNMSAKSPGWLLEAVFGFYMTNHGDEDNAERCSNYAANDWKEYRNTINFKHAEF